MTYRTVEPNEGTQHAIGRPQKPPALVDERGAIDIAAVSGGEFSPDPQSVYEQWAQFSAWHAANSETIRAAEASRYIAGELGVPVPQPRHRS